MQNCIMRNYTWLKLLKKASHHLMTKNYYPINTTFSTGNLAVTMSACSMDPKEYTSNSLAIVRLPSLTGERAGA
jgi:hypothetical protein